MPRTTTMRLRALWFQVHKWIGLSLAILIVPISISGSALVWRDGMDSLLHPDRHAVSGPARASASFYADAARAGMRPGERIASLRLPDGDGPVVVTLASAPRPGPPQRLTLWLDPASGRLLDRGPALAGLMRLFHDMHGSLMVPGAGRAVVGVVGAAMFCSCLTGLWLWWPLTGSVRRGFRWRRQNSGNANLHHLLGFWILLPLAMLSLTGALIAFPALTGGGGGGEAAERLRRARALPLAQPVQAPDAAVARAGAGRLATLTWPTDQRPQWTVAFAGAGAATVDDASGAVTAARADQGSRGLSRRLHDGTGMGTIWQVLIFIAGLVPAFLAVTGIVMWLRSRGWRAALAAKRKAAMRPAA